MTGAMIMVDSTELLAVVKAANDLGKSQIENIDEHEVFGKVYSGALVVPCCRVCKRAVIGSDDWRDIEHSLSCVVGDLFRALADLRLTPVGLPAVHREPSPELRIEYEVEEHPWASEEGCAPIVRSHEEAAAAQGEVFSEAGK